MADTQLRELLIKILKKFGSQGKGSATFFNGDEDNQRQFILCGSTIPNELSVDMFKKWCRNLKHVRSPNSHKISDKIKHDWIHVD